MKKILALALTTVAASTAAYAQSSVTIYGLLDLSVGISDTGEGTTLPGGTVRTPVAGRVYRMDSGLAFGSRLGFRGTEDLGGGLRANFLLEMGIAADTGSFNQGGLSFGRQAFVGLGGSNWSLSAGRQYTPMNNSIAANEPLGGGHWGNITAQALASFESIGSSAATGSFQLAARANNSVLLSVTGAGFTGNVMVAAGDENTRGTGRFINLGGTYVGGPLRADVSYARMRQNAEQIIATAPAEWLDLWMVGGSYNLNFARLFAGAFRFNAADNKANFSPVNTVGAVGANFQAYSWNKQELYWFGASVPFGLSTVKAQVARQKFPYTGAPEGKATIFGVAYDYALSKRTSLYASYGSTDNNERSRTPLYGAIPLVGPNGFGSDPRALSAGMYHRF